MLELVFLTSNRIKLAHARFLLKGQNINILAHKQIHYGKSYVEPRLFKRDELLSKSIKDAIKRWKKKIASSESRFYFIEDTSVNITSLSGDDEFPGVDVKHWMKETSFIKLDKLLKQKGNDRTAVVYSHIGLLLNDRLTKKYGVDHMIFKSSVQGRIVDIESNFNSNILYPWLDNQSFNKWFVPDGYTQPMSLLPIADAMSVDFRKAALMEMLNFLTLNTSNHHSVVPFEKNYAFSFRPLFIVVGPSCAGKTTLGKFLVDTYGYYHIEASDFMQLEYLETHGTAASIDVGQFAKALLLADPTVISRRILQFLPNITSSLPLVVTGFRTHSEVDHFIANLPYRDKVCLLFLTADFSTRYTRWTKRNRNLTDPSEKAFEMLNTLQNAMGLEKLPSHPRATVFENNETIKSFFHNFRNAFMFGEREQPLDSADSTTSQEPPMGLEATILESLSTTYTIDNKVLYTTTEIYHLTKKLKHKDNISRYFNQKFSPFYEVKRSSEKNRYALSPTGYSQAISLRKFRFPK